MVKQIQPQEIEVFYVLPALRRELTIAMKEMGYTQKKIARLLGVTEPAVSQYVNSKRAVNVNFNDHLKEHIKDSAKKIQDPITLTEETQFLLRIAGNDKITCRVCNDVAKTDQGCSVCFRESCEEH
ncbi:MAG: helix-turn-helix domain-containing protein [Nanoarchaeota archaeon]